jgi:hypothetical protein
MQPNPVLRKLGFSDQDRVAIIHTDDIGMCQASVAAFAELWDFGLISSGAVMVPCPWFLEAAAYSRAHPQADLGVHLTLTCEWKTYRWGPISTRDTGSGLLDEQGYFYHRSQDVQAHADPEYVAAELVAQVQRAAQEGLPVTHIDTHMGTVAHPKFMGTYLQVAMQFGAPTMMFRMDEAGWRKQGLDAETARMAANLVAQLEGSGLPLLDHITGLPLDNPEDCLGQAKQAFDNLKPGITHFIIHPSKDTPELRAIAPDWLCRVQNYQTFLRDDLRAYVRQSGVQVIGYAALKALMPRIS